MDPAFDYDSSFLEFSAKLNSSSPLYLIRDLLFNSFSYHQIGHKKPSRHRFGVFSWIPWALTRSRSIALPVHSGDSTRSTPTLDVLVGGHSGAHWMSIRLILEGAVNCRLHVRIWALGGVDELADDSVWRQCEVVDTTTGAHRPPRRLRHVWMALIGAVRTAKTCGLNPMGRGASQMADSMLSFFNWRAAWKERLKHSEVRIAIVTSESSPANKSFVEAVSRSGARVCHFCHGLPFASHAVTQSTDLFAFSRVDAEWFRTRVALPTRVHAIGNPRMDQTRSEVLRIQEEAPLLPIRILFFSNGLENPYTFEQESEDLAILRLPPDLRNNTILHVRPHPRENVETLEHRLRMSGLQFEISRDRSLTEDIAWAQICATPWSTALLEAIACERACFWTNARNDRMVGTGDYIDAGMGTLVMNSVEWEIIIRSIIEYHDQLERYRLRGTRLHDTRLIPSDEVGNWYQRLKMALEFTDDTIHTSAPDSCN